MRSPKVALRDRILLGFPLLRNLLNVGFKKAEALRRAQLALLKNSRFNQPHFSAPHMFIGD